jgi:hypothetical protein
MTVFVYSATTLYTYIYIYMTIPLTKPLLHTAETE